MQDETPVRMCSNNPLLPCSLRLSPLTLHTLAWKTWLTLPRYAAAVRSILLFSFSLLSHTYTFSFPPDFAMLLVDARSSSVSLLMASIYC
jgi:hypothetical protein